MAMTMKEWRLWLIEELRGLGDEKRYGPGHIVLDDNNFDDKSIVFCLQECAEWEKDPKRMNSPCLGNTRALLEELMKIPEKARTEDLPARICRIDTFVSGDGRRVIEIVTVNEPCRMEEDEARFVGEGTAKLKTPQGTAELAVRFPLPDSENIQEAFDAWPDAYEEAVEKKRRHISARAGGIIIAHPAGGG